MKTKPIKNPLAYIARLKKQNERLLKRVDIWKEMYDDQGSYIKKLKEDLHYAGECVKITERTIETLKNSNDWWKNYSDKVERIFDKAGFLNKSEHDKDGLEAPSIKELEELAFDSNTPEELSKAAIEKLNHEKENCEYNPKDLNQFIKSNHLKNRNNLIEKMGSKSTSELIESFLVEMDAKNEAYYFIIESDLMVKFRKYCEALK